MFHQTYPALYRDRFGEIATTIQNNGEALSITLRGTTFTGPSPQDWELDAHADPALEQQFSFFRQTKVLSQYILDFAMPLPVISHQGNSIGTLHIHFDAAFTSKNGVAKDILTLTLEVAGLSFASHKDPYWMYPETFESALQDLARKLPEDMSIQSCLFCAFSSLNPGATFMFGSLACCREHKQEVLRSRGMPSYELWNTYLTEEVQETHSCHEFEKARFEKPTYLRSMISLRELPQTGSERDCS